MRKITFWNNKGGTGKTSLAFQIICEYAHSNPRKSILVIDSCPQANLSELLLGGLNQGGGENLLKIQGGTPRPTIGGYFQERLSSPFEPPKITPSDYMTIPAEFNCNIPNNIKLLCGDPLLELQANAISTLSNTQLPTVNSWIAVIDWLNDFLNPIEDDFDIAFMDTNPSFSMYTQIALAASNLIMLPVMADDSSRRAINNAFSLIYGLKLPSDIYTKYAYAEKLKDAGRNLPKVHAILKNRITQYMGPASAYSTVLSSIDCDLEKLLEASGDIFSFTTVEKGTVNIRDFQTTGVVSFARGCPFYKMSSGRMSILGKRVQVKEEYRQNCIASINEVVNKFLCDNALDI